VAASDLTLPDGRSLRVWTHGVPAGLTLVYHPGTPSGVTPEPEIVAAAERAGLGLVVLARPGYAGSTRRPGRDVASVATDTDAALAALGIVEFVTLGWSGGGPHALACAARSEGCRAAVSLAGAAPWDAEGLDQFGGMGPENVEEFHAAVAGEQTLRPWLESASAGLGHIDAAGVVAALGGLLPPVDVAALTGERAEHFAASMRQALAGGVDGWLDDDLAFVRSWGFAPAEITVPVAVWQGDLDAMVPFAHGRWLAEHLPTAVPHLLPGEGHLSIGLDRLDEIVGDLVAIAG
jgi:pimeloyl-ACP methyl ester carboxylesterase